ncbi:50S ribosomal protein L10 [Mycoplasma sp. ATU-Cv-703]|uniref:50S ribosomal protein L10 n=1 Tax=Mycoplasma sp. ATU-Cv-703 TaxID=2498595 RepID=UPI001374ACD0
MPLAKEGDFDVTNKEVKQSVVEEIAARLGKVTSLVVAQYHGLTVRELQSLREKLSEAQISAKVYKNRLFKLALEGSPYKDLARFLQGPNLFVFTEQDQNAPAKILANFAKDHPALALVAGTYEGEVLDQHGINQIAELPSYEEGLTMLAMSLMGPIRYLAIALNQYAEQKTETGEEKKDEQTN